MEDNYYLFIGGIGPDKKKFKKVQEKMAKDPEIKYLIRKGKRPYNIFIILFFILVGGFFNYMNLKFINNFSGNIILLLFFTSWALWELSSFIATQTRKEFNLISYLKRSLSPDSPSSPLDIWTSLFSNLSDAQPSLYAAQELDKESSFIYTGKPYYKNVFIDNVIIKWNLSWWEYIKHYFNYRELLRIFAVKTISGQKFHRSKQDLKTSNSVFGILFLSEYLYKVYDNFAREDINDTFNIYTNNELSPEKKEFAKALFKLASTPTTYEFKKDEFNHNNENYSFEIKEVHTSDDYKRRNILGRIYNSIKQKFNLKRLKNKEIRIPVKKFLALPYQYDNNYNKKCTFDCYIPTNQTFESDDNSLTIIALGGTEHNLALLHLINKYKWDNPGQRKVGIAENLFDNPRENPNTGPEILFGTESFVYTIDYKVSAKELDEENKWIANVFTLQSKKYNIYSIFGKSAPITKIAAKKFIDVLKKQKLEELPGYNDSKNLIYKLTGIKEEYDPVKLLDYWDEKDFINWDDYIDDDFNKHIEVKDLQEVIRDEYQLEN